MTSLLPRILSSRARSVLRILPRSGRMAWKCRSRPCLAQPPALSPSTMYSSHLAGSRSEQSASLPGRVRLSSADLRMTRSRAFLAASRARAEVRHFSMMALASRGFSSRKAPKASHQHLLDVGLHFGVHQLDLGLRLELRVAVLDADDGGQAFARVVAGEVRVGVLEQAALAGVVVDDARQRRAQAGQVRAAVDRVDGVGERIDRLGVGIGVLHRHFDAHVFHLALDVHHRVQALAVAVQVAHERGDAAFEVEVHLAAVALVAEVDGHAARDERHLAEAADQRLEAVVQAVFLEDLPVELESLGGAVVVGLHLAHHRGWRPAARRARSAGSISCRRA